MTSRINQEIKGYVLEEMLGEGGFGAVYRAHQPLVKREVAIKVILSDFANRPEFVRRFETEAQLVARLEHLHIVPLYDYWRDPTGAYLVMRMLRGGSLKEAIADNPWSVEETARLLDQIAAALAIAHRNNVIHRDMKPANILLDEERNAYLSDFGIAKVSGKDGGSEMGAVVGSPAYISPEQIQSQTVTAQTDIYGLGIVIFETLTGTQPYGAKTSSELIVSQLRDPVPSLQEYRSDLPPGLDTVVQTATAKNPEDRYETPVDFARAFRQALQNSQAAPATQAADDLDDELLVIVPEGLQPFTATAETMELDQLDIELVNPYKGLRPFEEGDANDFFGRDALIEQLLNRLQETEGHYRFLAVVGPSGSGKSSVVKAGVIPQLRQGAFPGSENYFYAEMVPGTDAVRELEAALLSVAINPPDNLGEELRASSEGLLKVVDQIIPDGDELLLFIDQFEEVFTQTEDNAVRTHFMDSLRIATMREDSRLRVIVTLRADFYDKPLLYQDFGTLLRERTEVVLPLSSAELEEAIVGPARQVGVRVESELVSTIVAEVNEQPGALPLLQYALTENFERQEGFVMHLETYLASGGVLGALARRAEELYTEMTPEQQEAVRQLFLRLVTLGEGTEDTRRRILWSELAFETDSEDDPLRVVLNTYGKYRLLTFDNDPQTREPTVEVAHEALIRQWERLREWLQNSREDLRTHRRLTGAVVEWKNANEDTSFLATGVRLQQFEALMTGEDIVLTPEEIRYVQASIDKREEARRIEEERQARELALERRARRFLRGLVAIMAIATVVAVGLSIFAFDQQAEAQEERDNAQVAREDAEEARDEAQDNAAEARSLSLAVQAQQALDRRDPFLAVALALEAVDIDNPPAQAQRILSDVAIAAGANDRFEGHSFRIWDVDFSPDGAMAVSSGGEQGAATDNVILWDMATGQEIRRFDGHTHRVYTVEFSPDGQTIFTGSRDNTMRQWDVSTGEQLQVFERENGDRIWQLAVSPDGTQVVTAHGGGDVLLWNVDDGTFYEFEGHEDAVIGVDFSSNGQTVASVAFDGTVKVWDAQAEKSEPLHELPLDGLGWSVAYNPQDSNQLLSGGDAGKIILWDLTPGELCNFETTEELCSFEVVHEAAVRGMDFSPDGTKVTTASLDDSMIVWDVESRTMIQRYWGHDDDLVAVDFSPDGKQALTTSYDTTLILWNIETETQPIESQLMDAHVGRIYDVEFDPASERALTASEDHTIGVWDFASGERVRRLTGHTEEVLSVAWSADGTRALSGASDGEVILWNVLDGDEERRMGGWDWPVRSVAFSPDGQMALVGGGIVQLAGSPSDYTILLLDVTQGTEIGQWEGHTDVVYAMAFSPDGTRALSASADGTVILWDVSDGTIIHRLEGHEDEVRAVAFSPEGRHALSGSRDTSLILWNLENGTPIRRFSGHAATVRSVAFSSDGRLALSGAGNVQSGTTDNSVILWQVSTGRELRRLQEHAAPVRGVDFGPNNHQLLSGGDDGDLIFWTINTLELDDLVAWTQQNYQDYEFSCAERDIYGIEPSCVQEDLQTDDEDGTVGPIVDERPVCPTPPDDEMLDMAAFATTGPYTIGFSNATTASSHEAFMTAWIEYSTDQEADIENALIRDAGGEIEQQISDIEDLVAQGVDLIIVNPVDSSTLQEVVEGVIEGGIPVIALQSRDMAAENPFYTISVGVDNFDIGCLTTVHLLSEMDGEGDIIQISSVEGQSRTERRLDGARGIFREYGDVNVAQHRYTRSAEAAREEINDFFNDGQNINGVWVDDGSRSVATLQAYQANEGRDFVPITGDDYVGLARFAQENDVQVVYVYPPTPATARAIQSALSILRGEAVASFVEIELQAASTEELRSMSLEGIPGNWRISDFQQLPREYWPEFDTDSLLGMGVE
jgi:WD40 repeat protein/ABC-type sugar transport system substrate-binding protein